MTWGKTYWPIFLTIAFLAFIIPEILALVKIGPVDNTLSNWVWSELKITSNEKMNKWSALDFLIFGQWMTLMTWLTWHFFFRKFT
jgi:hypothetical protein